VISVVIGLSISGCAPTIGRPPIYSNSSAPNRQAYENVWTQNWTEHAPSCCLMINQAMDALYWIDTSRTWLASQPIWTGTQHWKNVYWSSS